MSEDIHDAIMKYHQRNLLERSMKNLTRDIRDPHARVEIPEGTVIRFTHRPLPTAVAVKNGNEFYTSFSGDGMFPKSMSYGELVDLLSSPRTIDIQVAVDYEEI